MLKKVFSDLDNWIHNQNNSNIKEGVPLISVCEVKVLGQMALLEAQLNLELIATADVDVYTNMDVTVRKKFDELLRAKGKFLDPDSSLIWMPQETEYSLFFQGKWLTALISKPEYVLLSKAIKAPFKNIELIRGYLALGPSRKFKALAKKYTLNLESFL